MYSLLTNVTLKTGEPMEIGVVTAPDPDWAEALNQFLSHKGGDWGWHVEMALKEPLDSLRSLFYVGHRNGNVICQIMIVGGGGAGILGHVYTRPAERRKGAIAALLHALMAHVRMEGFEVLTLGTGFDSHAYWIYHNAGFRGVAEGSGIMLWESEPGVSTRLTSSSPEPVTARPTRWEDWPFFNLLATQPVDPVESLPRSRIMGLKGQGNVEGAFLGLQRLREESGSTQALTLTHASGAAVGWAILTPDRYWFDEAWVLDIWAHPAYLTQTGALLEELSWPDAPVCALVTPGGIERVLLQHGFAESGRLPHWPGGDEHDIVVLVRQPATVDPKQS